MAEESLVQKYADVNPQLPSRKARDIKGVRFSSLVALKYVGNDKVNRALWLCACDCGDQKVFPAVRLSRGQATHCGDRIAHSALWDMRKVEEKFWARVNKNGSDGCWLWTGKHNTKGYGRLRAFGRRVLASHFSFELANGSIPSGLIICHRCDNPSCVNPAHLYAGTYQQNSDDAVARSRIKTKLTSEMVVQIRLASMSGQSSKDIAETFGVDPSNISRIINRKTWNHLS